MTSFLAEMPGKILSFGLYFFQCADYNMRLERRHCTETGRRESVKNMEIEFWTAIVLDLAVLALLTGLAKRKVKCSLPVKVLSLALGLLFIFGTSANCANGIHTPLIPNLIGLALSSAASCLALEGPREGTRDE